MEGTYFRRGHKRTKKSEKSLKFMKNIIKQVPNVNNRCLHNQVILDQVIIIFILVGYLVYYIKNISQNHDKYLSLKFFTWIIIIYTLFRPMTDERGHYEDRRIGNSCPVRRLCSRLSDCCISCYILTRFYY